MGIVRTIVLGFVLLVIYGRLQDKEVQ